LSIESPTGLLRSAVLVRSFVLIGMALLAFLLTACEKPDFTGVKFRPPEVDPNAHKTSFRCYLFIRQPQKVVWGNEFLFHSRSVPEQEYSSLKAIDVVLDEAVHIKSDETGLVALDCQSEGFHPLRFRYDGVEYTTHLQIKREHVTLVVLELSRERRLYSSSYVVPHTFLTVLPFKRLLSFHQGVVKLLPIYEEALHGRSVGRWERLLSKEYKDDTGGREDFLKSLKARAGSSSMVKVLDAQSQLQEDSAFVVARLDCDGRPDFSRLELKMDDRSVWRIVSIQD